MKWLVENFLDKLGLKEIDSVILDDDGIADKQIEQLMLLNQIRTQEVKLHNNYSVRVNKNT